jgi:hypothetical protein
MQRNKKQRTVQGAGESKAVQGDGEGYTAQGARYTENQAQLRGGVRFTTHETAFNSDFRAVPHEAQLGSLSCQKNEKSNGF